MKKYQNFCWLTVLTNMINGTSTEFSKEFLGTKCSEILNYKRPQMKYIVPGDTITLFYYHNLCTQQLCLYSSTKATWSCSYDQNLQWTKICFAFYSTSIMVICSYLPTNASEYKKEYLGINGSNSNYRMNTMYWKAASHLQHSKEPQQPKHFILHIFFHKK
jgi:hypothetical protein